MWEFVLETSSIKLGMLHKDKRLVCADLTALPQTVQLTHSRKGDEKEKAEL